MVTQCKQEVYKKPKPPNTREIAVIFALQAVGYVVNLKCVKGVNLRVIEQVAA